MATKCGISVCVCFVLHASAARIKVDTKPCDVMEANMKKYRDFLKKECPPSGCKFWDSCPKQGGKCAEGCLPYSGALGLTVSQRATKAIGHSLTGSCEKTCRYTDETMMATAEDGGAFATTSAAILEYKLAVQDEGCGNIFSKAKATCGARQRKIASVFGFLMRNLFKASTFAKTGEIDKCNAMLPAEIRTQLSTGFQKIVENMIATGAVSDIPTDFLNFLGRIPTLPQLCEKLHEMRSAEMNMSSSIKATKMKNALQEASGGELSEEALQHTFATLENIDAEDAVNQALEADEKQLAAVLDEADGNRSSLVQTDSQAFVHGIFSAFWSTLLHGVIGTIFGAFTTLACWVSMGHWSDDMGWDGDKYGITEKQLKGSRRSAWLVICPIQSFKVFWGLDKHSQWDWAKDLGLDWKNVKRTFEIDD